MGPEAASELEPAGTWKGFCLPGATGCWEGSAKPGLLSRACLWGQQQGWSQPAVLGSTTPVGWEWPCGRMGVLSPLVGACPQAPCLWGNISWALLRRVCVPAVVRQCQEKTGTVALLGAVSAHWCGAGTLASWKSWKTAPGALWRWGRGAQPGF